MKPDKPGEWYSREGSRIVVYHRYDTLYCRAVDDREGGIVWAAEFVQGDDWLPAEPPKFPELPPKPTVVQCLVRHVVFSDPHWVLIRRDRPPGQFYLSRLTVIPHPDNDPVAVRLIADAKQG